MPSFLHRSLRAPLAYRLAGRRKDHRWSCPLVGMERPRRAVRFARLIHRRGRDLGGPSARAAYGGSLSLTWLLLSVVWHD